MMQAQALKLKLSIPRIKSSIYLDYLVYTEVYNGQIDLYMDRYYYYDHILWNPYGMKVATQVSFTH